jgi:hypothetical protein
MRTSNKILLFSFLTAVLIITGIHIALKAKIDSGNLVVIGKRGPGPFDNFEAPGVKHVIISGFEDCRVYYSDTAQFKLTKNWKDLMDWKVNGDTLIIEAGKKYETGERLYQPVLLYLPNDVDIHGRYTNFFLYGDTARENSRTVTGETCEINVRSSASRGISYWKKLNISTTDAVVDISPDCNIEELELSLGGATRFMDGGAKFGSISARLDSTSTMTLSGGNIEKVKFIKQ